LVILAVQLVGEAWYRADAKEQ